ncbi:hypothetical protein SLA2020_148580 [Shorea laevis]
MERVPCFTRDSCYAWEIASTLSNSRLPAMSKNENNPSFCKKCFKLGREHGAAGRINSKLQYTQAAIKLSLGCCNNHQQTLRLNASELSHPSLAYAQLKTKQKDRLTP